MFSAATPTWVTEDMQLFQDNVRRFVAREFEPHETRWSEQRLIDRDAWHKAGAAGLLCASIPEEYGGGGGTFAHEAIICAELARAVVTSFGNNVHSGIVAHYILNYGTEEQKRRWLPEMASGRMIGAIAMSEPGAGSDLRAIRTRATRDGDGYRIHGAKTFITNGIHADLICVVAKTAPDLGSKGVSLIMVEAAKADGFRRGRNLDKLGQKGQDTAELFFEDVWVPSDALLGGEEGQGMYQLMQQLPKERLIIAVGAVASMFRAIEMTIAYTKDRKVFGKPLFDMQNTRFRLAECQSLAVIADNFVNSCVTQLLSGKLDAEAAAIAKWWCSEQYGKVVDECLQLHGGYGYMLEYPIARMYANARVTRIYGGSTEVMKEVIARAL